MGIHKYKYNFDFFKKPSEELYYFLGFIAADGYISNNEIEIGINQKDKYLLERFRDIIVPNKPLYYKTKTNSYTLKLSMKRYIPEIKKFYGMISNNKHAESVFPCIPRKYTKDFIRGYVDGDGCIDSCTGHRNKTIYIGPRLRILGNKNFLTELNNATKKFVKHNTQAITPKGKENVSYLTYNFSTAENILHWLYDNCKICLDRKLNKYKEVIQNKMKI